MLNLFWMLSLSCLIRIPRPLYLLYIVPFFVVVFYCIFAFLYRMKLEAQLLNSIPIEPKFPECGRVSPSNFDFCGPLKMQSRLKCDVKHQLSGEQSAPIENVVYDENLNEVVDIGSDIEELVMMSESTISEQPIKTKNMSQYSISVSSKSMKFQESRSDMTGRRLKIMRR